MDHEIATDAFDPARLRTVLDEVRPLAIAFNGKRAARLAFGLRDSAPIDLGPAAHALGATAAWVLPSTSGGERAVLGRRTVACPRGCASLGALTLAALLRSAAPA
jgi:hypothetical protein